jgi:signal transduction histidine kinase
VLRLLRDEERELGLAPEMGLGRLDELVERFRRNGLDVDLRVDGPLHGLPPGVDISGYRIVQEALTNALRHAAHRAVRLHVKRESRGLSISAANRVAPTDRATRG